MVQSTDYRSSSSTSRWVTKPLRTLCGPWGTWVLGCRDLPRRDLSPDESVLGPTSSPSQCPVGSSTAGLLSTVDPQLYHPIQTFVLAPVFDILSVFSCWPSGESIYFVAISKRH